MFRQISLIAAFCLPAWSQITLIAHGNGQAISGSGTATTGTMIGTGGNFIAACVTTFASSCTGATVSDSVNGAWTLHGTNQSSNSGAASNSCIWYKQGASVSASMTVSATETGGFAEVAAGVFSNVATSSALDQENGAAYGNTGTAQPGSITPSQANELLISCTGVGATSGTMSISGNSYALADSNTPTGSNTQATGMGYVVQTTATTANPTWNYGSLSGANGGGLTQESFKQAGAGGATNGIPLIF